MFDFDIDSVLEQDTITRSENFEQETEKETDFSDLEFEDEDEEIEQEQEEREIVFTDADAKEGAEVLVDMIDTFNTVTMTPLAKWKLQKKRGLREKGKIAEMEFIASKDFAGQKLTEAEKRKLYQYNTYLASLQKLEEVIPYTDDERKRLIKSAIPMVKKMKWKVGGATSFGLELAMIQGSRIMDILTAE